MIEFLSSLPPALYVAIISMVPLIELRGAIPVGVALGMEPWLLYTVAVIANCIPIPFILWLMPPIMRYLKKTRALRWFADFLERKTEKNKDKVLKYSTFGLFLFVAIPLPGTGAWSGALIASLLDLKPKYAFISIVCGVIGAGLIMSLGSYAVEWLINLF
ncbi:MAG: small multi-drug export protein [Clostridia bacterium]|nr:small multi-drug export protein [Clostridia bacterium]